MQFASLLLQLSLSSQPPQPYIVIPDHLFPNKNNKKNYKTNQKDFCRLQTQLCVEVKHNDFILGFLIITQAVGLNLVITIISTLCYPVSELYLYNNVSQAYVVYFKEEMASNTHIHAYKTSQLLLIGHSTVNTDSSTLIY